MITKFREIDFMPYEWPVIEERAPTKPSPFRAYVPSKHRDECICPLCVPRS